eukprot:scaffold186838_cov20-Tisochrysis_lutea.AAC.2
MQLLSDGSWRETRLEEDNGKLYLEFVRHLSFRKFRPMWCLHADGNGLSLCAFQAKPLLEKSMLKRHMFVCVPVCAQRMSGAQAA